MTGFVIFLHVLVCIFIALVVLMQSGRGGGLTEHFASAESMFGAHTNEFMIKATTVLASLFFVTCITLAVLSSQKGKSLMSERVTIPVDGAVPALLGEKMKENAPASSPAQESSAPQAGQPETQKTLSAPQNMPEPVASDKAPQAAQPAPAIK